MRKLTNSTYISLDGIIQDPHNWPSGNVSDDRGSTIQTELLMSCEIQIMGRRAYDGFAMVWPTRSSDPYSDHINAMRKIVFPSQVTAHSSWGMVARRISSTETPPRRPCNWPTHSL